MPNVLILEDDTAFGAVLGDALALAGHRYCLANSSTRALQLLRAHRFDVLVLDVFVRVGRRHEGAGMRLLHKVRRQKCHDRLATPKSVPIIVMSGAVHRKSSEGVLVASSIIGADRTLAKPFALAQLRKALDEVLEDGAEAMRH